MKATKLELQQSLNRVNADLVHALEQLSEARGNIEFLESCIQKHVDFADKQRATITELNTKLNEADIRAKRLIASNNRARSTEVSERRKIMEAARAKAMSAGVVVKVGA